MVEIIAEVGVNWDGKYRYLEFLVRRAKEIGCDAVKFQAFGKEHWKNYPQFPNLKNCAVTEDNIDLIDEVCTDNNIEWFCTPTYKDCIEWLNPYVKRYKVRFKDQHNEGLIDGIIDTHKPIIISTQNPAHYNSRYKTLYGIPDYPTNFKDIEFDRIPQFDGYSNHCPDKKAPILAAFIGAQIIEIHVTPNKIYPFIDNPVSFDMVQMEDIVCLIKA